MSYWTDRVKARQRVYDRSSAQVGRIITDAHKRMLEDIREDAGRIFGNFEAAFDLTPDEARALLKSPLSAREAERLLAGIDQIKDPQYRRLMQAKASSGAYAHRLSRLDATRASAEIAAIRVADVEKEVGQQHFGDVFSEGYNRTMFDIQKDIGIGFSFAGVDERRIKQVLRNNWSGKNYSRRVWLNNETMSRELSRALIERIMQGKTSRETFRALVEQSDMGRFAANRLLATETTYIANQATAEAYEDAGITHYRFMAVLDGRTSNLCADKDGEIFPLAEQEVGVNYPPLHPWCRSTTAPEIPGLVRERMERWARDPETGKEMKVDGSLNYKQWRESLKTVDGKQAPTLADKVEATLAKPTETQKQPEAPKGLTSDQKDALEQYASGESMWINQYLRDRGDFGELSETEAEMLKNLDDAVESTVVKQKTLYRSVNADALWGDMSQSRYEDMAENILYGDDGKKSVADFVDSIEGKTIHEKGFLSTTKEKELALEFGDFTGSDRPVVIEFSVPEGIKGYDMKAFEVEGEEQAEVLIARGQSYKVLSVKNEEGAIYVKAELILKKKK